MSRRYLPALLSLLLGSLACGGAVATPPAPVTVIYIVSPTPVAAETPVIPGEEVASVARVIDGDTIDVLINGLEYRVRYIGINTPERNEDCYDGATTANAVLVEGQTVRLEKDISETDRYDRLLRYVYVQTPDGEVFVNEQLVLDGWAEAARYEPDVAFADYFDNLEALARAANLGCHPSGIFN